MIRRIAVCLIAAALLFGCKSEKKEAQAQAPAQNIIILNLKLPKFKDIFAKLDQLGASDFNKAIPGTYTQVTDVNKAAFTLGSLTADAIVATKARNDKKLIEISSQMIHYSEMVTQDANIKKMAEDLRTLVQEKKWDDLEMKLDAYRDDVINSLYNNKDYSVFVLLELGGWNEGLNLSSTLVSQHYRPDHSNPVSERASIGQMLQNLQNFPDDKYKNDPAYKTALANFQQIDQILKASTNEQYTKDQIEQLRTLTDAVKKAYQ